MNNYRVDIFYKSQHYMVEFPEYWLAIAFADTIKENSDVNSVYLLERITDKSFDITKRIK